MVFRLPQLPGGSQAENAVTRLLRRLNVHDPVRAVTEPKIGHNHIAIADRHNPQELRRPFTVLRGVGAGGELSRTVCKSHASIHGLKFRYDGTAETLRVAAAATVVVTGATFIRDAGAGQTHVHVESGGKLVLIGCTFIGGGTGAAVVVDHPAGAATDVQLIGCRNLTGNTLAAALTVTETGTI
jgi:hypothetical protein